MEFWKSLRSLTCVCTILLFPSCMIFLTVFQFTKEIKQELFRRELVLLLIVASFRRISKPSVRAKIFSKETTSFIVYIFIISFTEFSPSIRFNSNRKQSCQTNPRIDIIICFRVIFNELSRDAFLECIYATSFIRRLFVVNFINEEQHLAFARV